MIGGGGRFWVGETLGESGNSVRLDWLGVAGGELFGRITDEGVALQVQTGIGVGRPVGQPAGEEKVYVGVSASGQGGVGVYGQAGGSWVREGVWSGAGTPPGSFTGGQEGLVSGVGVDESAGLATSGDVYVAVKAFLVQCAGHPCGNSPAEEKEKRERERLFNVVDVFGGQVGGGEPALLGQLTGTCPSSGVCSGEEEVPFSAPDGVAVSGLNGDVLVEDGPVPLCEVELAQCVIDVFEPVGGMPGVYSFRFAISGTPTGPLTQPAGMAVDPRTGDIYVVEDARGVVDEFNAEGSFVAELAGTPGRGATTVPFGGENGSVRSVAVDGLTGDVLVGAFDHTHDVGVVDEFEEDRFVPNVEVEPATGVSVGGATLRGTVNPEGKGEAGCEFEFGTSEAFGQRVACSPARIGSVSEKVPVSATVSGLSPDTEYFYRVDASNLSNGLVNLGEFPADRGRFTTLGPGLVGESVSSVADTAATLDASVSPHCTAATHCTAVSYYFEYGRTSSYEAQTPAPPGVSLSEGEGQLSVSRRIQGLSPNSLYHYRVVLVGVINGVRETFPGPDQTFTTQPPGAGLQLPDGRRWELVSPANKKGSVMLPILNAGVVQAAASDAGLSYMVTLPPLENPEGYFEYVQLLSRRSPAGWSTQEFALPHDKAVGITSGAGGEYKAFNEDLSSALIEPFDFVSLAPMVFPPAAQFTLYLQHIASCSSNPGTCYEPLVVGCPPGPEACPPLVQENADIPSGIPLQRGAIEFVGSSADLNHVIVRATTPLRAQDMQAFREAEEAKAQVEALYEWSADAPPQERLQPVSLVPQGSLFKGAARLGRYSVGAAASDARDAVSTDGSRVVWTAENHHLYMRDLKAGVTIPLDIVKSEGKQLGVTGASVFQGATPDGSRVFFTDSQALGAESGTVPGEADLYECHIVEEPGGPACALTDLTPASQWSGESAAVLGVLPGISSDGSTVYFVANGALTSDPHPGGCSQNSAVPLVGVTCGLYVEHYNGTNWEAPKLIAMLDGGDWPDWEGKNNGELAGLSSLLSRVSPSGRYLEFMSMRSLTGYDNHDAHTGKADEEVFLYDAMAGHLICASCNPTGARPDGVPFRQLEVGKAGLDGGELWGHEQGIAASVPGWTAFTAQDSAHQPRYLSDNGRLFFNSSDALVPQDTNNNVDVYEYEPVGIDCTMGSPTYNAATNGCTSLITSGTAPTESAFLDANENGDDVYFLTDEQLTRQDTDTATDVYDAHVCTAAEPCSPESQPPPSCNTPEACRSLSTPEPVGGMPPTSTYTGPGNPPSPKPVKPTVRKHPSTCHKRKSRHKPHPCKRKTSHRPKPRRKG
jgi:hypothetical protein